MPSGITDHNGLSRLNKTTPPPSHDDASSADNRQKQATLASAGDRGSSTTLNHCNNRHALLSSPPRLIIQSSNCLTEYPAAKFTPVIDKKRTRYLKPQSLLEDSPSIRTPVRPPSKKVKSEPQSPGKQQQLKPKPAPAPRLGTRARNSVRDKRTSLQLGRQSGDNSKNRFSFASNGTVNLPKVNSAKSKGKKKSTTKNNIDRCCNCSKTSMCSRERDCACKKAKRECTNCCGFDTKCKNKNHNHDNKNPTNSKSTTQSRAPPQPCKRRNENDNTKNNSRNSTTTQKPIINPYSKRKAASTDSSDGVSRRLDYGITELPSGNSPQDESSSSKMESPSSESESPSSPDESSSENADHESQDNATDPPAADTRQSPSPTTQASDLPGATISPANRRLDTVYGDHIHDNPGEHLDGGIEDDGFWQDTYRRLIALPNSQYKVPKRAVGKDFIYTLAQLFDDIIDRKCNSEKLLTFIMVVLQRTPEVKSSQDVRRRLEWRMAMWKRGEYQCIVEDTLRSMESSLSTARGATTFEQRAKVFDAKVKGGNLRAAVRYITDREGGGVLAPDEIDDKSGKTVIDALRDKHPPMREPGEAAMHTYDTTPSLIDLDITEDTVESVASKISGSAGLSGMDSVQLKHLLLQHGGASKKLRQAVAKFARWMANTHPPFAAYRALIWARLVALGKNPGIRPIGIGDIWRRLLAKCILAVAGASAAEACGSDQLCAGLSAGIEGAIHGMSQMWEESEALENWGFLLVDARNAFNELNRINMLWTVRHEWPAGARFTFNCYCHHGKLVCRAPDGTDFTISSEEGITQGDPLAMPVYAITLLPLGRKLKLVDPPPPVDIPPPVRIPPPIVNTWYADDTAAAGKYDAIEKFFKELVRIGPDFGYFPEPSKSILIVRSRNLQSGRLFFNEQRRRGFQITTGHRYLGGFIGEVEKRDEWLSSRLLDFEHGIKELAGAAKNYPQTAYAGLQKSLQHEWAFLQRVLPDIGEQFQAVEDAITNDFLPAMFGESSFEEDDYRRSISELPVRFCGLGIPNPTTSSAANYEASTLVSSHLIQAVQEKIPFRPAKHMSTRQQVLSELRPRRDEAYKDILASFLSSLPDEDGKGSLARLIGRAGKTGQWLSCMPSTVSGTELGRDEFRDAIRLRYGRTPANLPEKCDGCGTKFTLEHALSCKVGGLVIQRHDEINQELGNLSRMALKPSAVRAEPLISTGSLCKSSKTKQDKNDNSLDSTDTRERGDLLVRSLWKNGSDCIIDVRVTDLEAASYVTRDPAKVLASHEQQKKKKYLDECLQQRRSFCPFVISTDGLLGFEAKNLLKQLARHLVKRWERPYSVVCGIVRARMSIACVRASHQCLRGSRVPFSKTSRRIQWSDGAGVGLFEVDRS